MIIVISILSVSFIVHIRKYVLYIINPIPSIPNLISYLLSKCVFSLLQQIKSFYGFTGALCNESLVVREDCMASKASNHSYQRYVRTVESELNTFL